jgi:molybdopterin-guanine dinucleotide biosynthesis protein A
MAFDAIVLAGGSATRLGGIDKMLVVVDGTRLIDRALAAVDAARVVVGVGSARPNTGRTLWTVESPPGGGPVAAIAAGLAHVASPRVVLLAADLPFVGPRHVARLLQVLDDGERDAPCDARTAPAGAMFTDPQGVDQPLLSAWDSAALRDVLPDQPAGHGLRRVLASLPVRRVPGGEDLVDCDTPEDVASARRGSRPPGDRRQECP